MSGTRATTSWTQTYMRRSTSSRSRVLAEIRRVLRPGGTLFHYTGIPNKLTSGRDVTGEVLRRLQQSGFEARRALDGVLARSVLKPIR